MVAKKAKTGPASRSLAKSASSKTLKKMGKTTRAAGSVVLVRPKKPAPASREQAAGKKVAAKKPAKKVARGAGKNPMAAGKKVSRDVHVGSAETSNDVAVASTGSGTKPSKKKAGPAKVVKRSAPAPAPKKAKKSAPKKAVPSNKKAPAKKGKKASKKH
ncbi:hypothetical protein TGPRC2_315610 [Toxoplasma gondii TgCatPRC2]|uniref:Uncharacterized protein n=15 Tax=Toxoplasma gondii TaxID=5811 RepID=B9PJ63_TOXGV|nr:hypothetical protein TGME49_315610 [Toxoplasma gondii ME49]EPR58937.1 hypothetical protein TGGT1_315610 [Toxoplasma gondii GT1]ESS35332.1 hypothetical protein TGVEG_315610 [Toxoplasma gondii VEG]KAF4639674.1 hypothetical protein TGRH88_054460 [Toxoplasma gondii]KFG36796.1 hypothetical protein TGDOM2_315610 [Toxoplasma gondii GAB2-2007-GAL-DOM2]KFG49466.1 hypothetical protein TGP89_315610 [Toxoplasma gondii p89]KFG56366.1 hypothetical protein TGFOU_315610 [Toxoplasma gondii FOU]KFG66364.1 |eukprot:XP_002364740.1 hypothetical protein TGME49_315610 [Toxoplasma gondii ME49]